MKDIVKNIDISYPIDNNNSEESTDFLEADPILNLSLNY